MKLVVSILTACLGIISISADPSDFPASGRLNLGSLLLTTPKPTPKPEDPIEKIKDRLHDVEEKSEENEKDIKGLESDVKDIKMDVKESQDDVKKLISYFQILKEKGIKEVIYFVKKLAKLDTIKLLEFLQELKKQDIKSLIEFFKSLKDIDIKGLADMVAMLKTQVATLIANQSKLTEDVKKLQEHVNMLKNDSARLDALEKMVTEIKGNLSALNTTQATILTDVNTLKEDVAQLKGQSAPSTPTLTAKCPETRPGTTAAFFKGRCIECIVATPLSHKAAAEECGERAGHIFFLALDETTDDGFYDELATACKQNGQYWVAGIASSATEITLGGGGPITFTGNARFATGTTPAAGQRLSLQSGAPWTIVVEADTGPHPYICQYPVEYALS